MRHSSARHSKRIKRRGTVSILSGHITRITLERNIPRATMVLGRFACAVCPFSAHRHGFLFRSIRTMHTNSFIQTSSLVRCNIQSTYANANGIESVKFVCWIFARAFVSYVRRTKAALRNKHFFWHIVSRLRAQSKAFTCAVRVSSAKDNVVALYCKSVSSQLQLLRKRSVAFKAFGTSRPKENGGNCRRMARKRAKAEPTTIGVSKLARHCVKSKQAKTWPNESDLLRNRCSNGIRFFWRPFFFLVFRRVFRHGVKEDGAFDAAHSNFADAPDFSHLFFGWNTNARARARCVAPRLLELIVPLARVFFSPEFECEVGIRLGCGDSRAYHGPQYAHNTPATGMSQCAA